MKLFRVRRHLAGTILGPLSLLCAGAALPSSAAAQNAPWEFYVTPYLWATSINAKVSPQRLPASHEIDVNFSQILKNLDGLPVIMAGEIRNGRFGLFADLIYLPVASDIHTRNILFNGGKSDLTTLMVAVEGFYRVSEDPSLKADVGGGFRLWSVSSKATLNPGILAGTSTKMDTTFVDPILAVRVKLALSDRWSISGYGDAGGFGIGKTKLTFQLFGTVNYKMADWAEMRAGWRYISVERGDNLTIGLNGPVVGATFRF